MSPIKFDECILSKNIEDFKQDTIINKVAIVRIKTGFEKVDDMLGGGLAPGLTVLGAATGLGKSTFILQVAENVSASETPVLYFSLEMTSNMIAAKAINRQLFLDRGKDKKRDREFSATDLVNSKVVSKLLNTTTWTGIEQSREIAENKSKMLYVFDSTMLTEKELTAEGIYQIVKQYVNEHMEGPKPLVIVDYLQILRADLTDNKGDRQSVEKCIRWMTKIHQEFKVAVVLISSLSRASYKQKVQQDSFKETGNIEYSSDVLLGLSFCNAPVKTDHDFDIDREKSKVPREVELSFLKQRYGVCGIDSAVRFDYYAKHDYFQEFGSGTIENKEVKKSGRKRNVNQSSDNKVQINQDSDNKAQPRERMIGSGKYEKGKTFL